MCPAQTRSWGRWKLSSPSVSQPPRFPCPHLCPHTAGTEFSTHYMPGLLSTTHYIHIRRILALCLGRVPEHSLSPPPHTHRMWESPSATSLTAQGKEKAAQGLAWRNRKTKPAICSFQASSWCEPTLTGRAALAQRSLALKRVWNSQEYLQEADLSLCLLTLLTAWDEHRRTGLETMRDLRRAEQRCLSNQARMPQDSTLQTAPMARIPAAAVTKTGGKEPHCLLRLLPRPGNSSQELSRWLVAVVPQTHLPPGATAGSHTAGPTRKHSGL